LGKDGRITYKGVGRERRAGKGFWGGVVKKVLTIFLQEKKHFNYTLDTLYNTNIKILEATHVLI